MRLISEATPIIVNNQKVRQGLFECPVCFEHVTKRMSHGEVTETCGSEECKSELLSLEKSIIEMQKEVMKLQGVDSMMDVETYGIIM